MPVWMFIRKPNFSTSVKYSSPNQLNGIFILPVSVKIDLSLNSGNKYPLSREGNQTHKKWISFSRIITVPRLKRLPPLLLALHSGLEPPYHAKKSTSSD